MRRTFLTCVATAALVLAAPAIASAASLKFISSSPFASASSASVKAVAVVASHRARAHAPQAHAANVAYVECPIYLLPGEDCCLAYNQYWGTSAVTFYSSSASPITKDFTYRGPDSGATARWRGIPSLGNYATSFLISGPSIMHAETYAC
jgi:hypothetical protein